MAWKREVLAGRRSKPPRSTHGGAPAPATAVQSPSRQDRSRSTRSPKPANRASMTRARTPLTRMKKREYATQNR